jgi:type I restriction enzyme S subunit
MHFLAHDFARFEAEGTVFGSIGKNGFSSLKCVLPDASIVRTFEGMVGPIDQAVENNERESRALAAVRDMLLPRLISGGLSSGQAERSIAEVGI